MLTLFGRAAKWLSGVFLMAIGLRVIWEGSLRGDVVTLVIGMICVGAALALVAIASNNA